jgi:hypothetical protein
MDQPGIIKVWFGKIEVIFLPETGATKYLNNLICIHPKF